MIPAAMLLLTSVALADFSPPKDAGPFKVEVTNVRMPLGRGRITTIVYRPVATESVAGKFPVVVFGHGFLAAARRYSVICRHLASHGFYIVAPEYPEPILCRPRSLPTDAMKASLDYTDSLSRTPSNRVDPTRVGLVGHSAGGGAAFTAAWQDTTGNVRAVAGLSPWQPPKWVARNLPLPALVIAGQNDGSTTTEYVRREFYDSAPGPRYFMLIRHGGHNGYLDHTCTIEDRFERFDRKAQLASVRTYLTAFLGFYLQDDPRYLPWLSGSEVAADTTIYLDHK